MATLFNEIKQLRNTAQLSLKEREDMLRRIYRISPHKNIQTSKSFIMNLSYVKQLGTRFATIAVLVGLTGGIGLTAAADNSLPNQLLYPLKIHITEPVRELTLISADSKVEFQKEIINRRFDEASALAQTGELDVKTEAALTEHVKTRVEKVKQLSESIVGVEDQLQLTTDLKNIIETKSNELASVIENNEQQENKDELQNNASATSTDGATANEDKKEDTTDTEKTTVSTSSLLAVADIIVEDIKVAQSATIEEVAKEDPAKADALSQQVYAQEFTFLVNQAATNLATAHVNVASLELLVPGAHQVVVVQPVEPVTTPVVPTDLTATPVIDSTAATATPSTISVSDTVKELISPTVPPESTMNEATPSVTITETTIALPAQETDLEKYYEFKKTVDDLESKLTTMKLRQPSEAAIIELKGLLASLQDVNNQITNMIEVITVNQEKNAPSFISSSISSLSEAEAKDQSIKEPSKNTLETQ